MTRDPILWLALVLASGCTESWETSDDDGVVRQVAEKHTGRLGRAVFHVPVPDGVTHMLFTARVADGDRVFVEELRDPDGRVAFDAEDHWDQPRGVTGAIAPKQSTSLNWPILGGDTPLSPGTWEVEIGVIDDEQVYRRRAPVVVEVVYKDDTDPLSGRIAANVVLAGDVIASEDAVSAAEDAVLHWQDLYARAGLQVDVDWFEYDDGELTAPGLGNHDDYVAIADATPLRSVNVVLVPEIVGSPGLYGIAGAIPGPLVPSPQSAVVLSTTVNAGTDGRYSPEEVRLLGETMAHEVGHYLGLFHPVEVTWDAWDALSDTPECVSERGCFETLGSNLMFPFPICTSETCRPQGELTREQIGVGHRYVGVE